MGHYEDQLLHGDLEPPEDQDPVVWSLTPPTPEDLDQAARHNRRAAVLARRIQEYRTIFTAEELRLKERLQETLAPLQKELEWRQAAVEAFHRANVGSMGKTLRFPSGPTSKLTARPLELVIEDPDALRAYLAEQGKEWEVWELVETYRASKLQALLTKATNEKPEPRTRVPALYGGEVVPGVAYVAAEDRWNHGKDQA
jgi:hypothetical protein